MKKYIYISILTLLFGCEDDPITVDNGHSHNHTHVVIVSNSFPNMVIPNDNELTTEGIELGRKLFYDPILSGDSTQSCSSCHQQKDAFSDASQFSIGINGLHGTRNASAIVNPGWLPSAFWDGRASSLEDQALGPVPNPLEMNLEWELAVARLQNSPLYPTLFFAAFADSSITKELVAKSIAQFERTLISDDSKFDKFQNGHTELSAMEAAGHNLFFSEKAECFHCHGQPFFTDNDFHNNGLDDVFADLGYEEVTGQSSDRGKFRTPTLRNIEFSAPYMHDGRFQTLEEVVEFYSSQVKTSSTIDPLMPNDNGGFNWTELEKQQLVAFLKTLSDSSFITNPDFKNPW